MAEYAEKFSCGDRRKINPGVQEENWMSAEGKKNGSKEISPK